MQIIDREEVAKKYNSGDEFILTLTGEGCVPCHIMQQAFSGIDELKGLPLYAIMAEEVPELCAKAVVMSVPTTLHIKESNIVEMWTRSLTVDQLKEAL